MKKTSQMNIRRQCAQAGIALAAAGFANPAMAEKHGSSSLFVEDALVHIVHPEEKRHDEAVIMVPGMNLSSSIFLATPDGREGWAQFFAREGFAVYVINDPNFDFSRGFNVPGFTHVPARGAPEADSSATQGWPGDVWRRWGFGSVKGAPYPETRFPTENYDVFAANYPYLSRARRSFAEAIAALLKETGPAYLMAHSAGGPHAVTAAKTRPDLVAGLVLIEPTGPPTKDDFPALAGKPMLGVYGDFIQSRRQGSRKSATESAAALFRENGGAGKVISLPDDHAIHGNTHLMMQDDNNAFVAGLIVAWLADPANGEPKKPVTDGGAPSDERRGPGPAVYFKRLDADGDGTLNAQEYGASRRFAEATEAELRAAFTQADLDADGSIDLEEYEKGFGSRRGRAGRR